MPNGMGMEEEDEDEGSIDDETAANIAQAEANAQANS